MPAKNALTHRFVSGTMLLVAMALVAIAVPRSAIADGETVFTGSVTAGTTSSWRNHTFEVSTPGVITATLDWDTPSANLNVFLYAPDGSLANSATTANRPESLTQVATQTGTWRFGVKGLAGSANYTLTVTTQDGLPAASFKRQIGFSGPAGNYPYGMTIDETTDTVIVGDYWNKKIRRYSKDGQFLGLIASGGNNTQPGLCVPYGLDTDPQGNIWVADQNCSRVVKYSPSGQLLQTIGRGGSPNYAFGCGAGKLNVPTHVLVDPDSGRVFVSDPKCGTIYAYRSDGTFEFEFNWAPATLGVKPLSQGMDFGPDGNIYVYEHNTRRIVVFNTDGQWIRNFPPRNDLNDVRGVAIDHANEVLYAVGAYHNRVYKFALDGTYLGQWGACGTTPFDSVRYVAADSNGEIWIGDTWGYRVHHMTEDAECLAWATPPAPPPNGGYNLQNGVALSPSGQLFVVDTYEQRIQAFDASKACTTKTNCPAFQYAWGARGENPTAKPEALNYPRALDYGDGSVWVGDNGNAILQFQPDGTFVNRIGSKGSQPGQFLGGVTGLEYADGKLYATDVTNCRLQVFAPDGTLLAHMGTCGTGANQQQWPRGVDASNGIAYVVEPSKNQINIWNTDTRTLTQRLKPTCGGTFLSGPSDVEIDPAGTSLYVTDTNNQRVVRMSLTGTNCEVVATNATIPGNNLLNTRYLEFGPDGTLYVSTSSRKVVALTIHS